MPASPRVLCSGLLVAATTGALVLVTAPAQAAPTSPPTSPPAAASPAAATPTAAATPPAAATPTAAATPAVAGQLTAGATLRVGQVLTSPSGTYRLVMQDDGNLVLYRGTTATWASGTATTGVTATASVAQLGAQGRLAVLAGNSQLAWQSPPVLTARATLVVQDDGNVVIYDPAGHPTWNSAGYPIPDLWVGQSLGSGGALSSPDGSTTVVLQPDGNLVVYGLGHRALWSSRTWGSDVTHLDAQSDGNFVLYNAAGVARWNSGTWTAGPSRLQVQDDGNLVAYAADGHAAWNSAAFNTTLPTGTTLGVGRSLHSAHDTAVLTMQGDGNLVAYAGGRAVWSSWTFTPGSHAVLQADGNFVVYTASGRALWSTRSWSTLASTAVVGDDGALALRDPAGRPVGYAAAATPSVASVSRYVRNLGTSDDTGIMRVEGCTDAQGNGGRRAIVLLDFGAQADWVSGQWGVQLTVSTIVMTDTAVVAAVDAYLDGYRACTAPDPDLTLIIGTNNDGSDVALSATGGQVFADQVVDPVAAHVAGSSITVAAGNDIEPGFAGDQYQAADWLRGYLGASPQPFWFFGSADGCPTTAGRVGSCNYGWTQQQLYDLSYGMAPGRMFGLPEIYVTPQVQQWANISAVGAAGAGRPLYFGGVITEVAACAQAGPCYSMSPSDAWSSLYRAISADARTVQNGLPFATDLRVDHR